MKGKEKRQIELLLVEDNPGDVRLIQEALREERLQINMHVAKDGVEALAYLKRLDDYSNAPHPDLILLDLNLPKKSGKEVLDEIKNDAPLKRTPVIILTASSAEKDIIDCYNLHANCYITKPVSMDRFMAVIRSIMDFWLTVVKLPQGD